MNAVRKFQENVRAAIDAYHEAKLSDVAALRDEDLRTKVLDSEKKVADLKRLKAEGLNLKQAAEAVGVSHRTAQYLLENENVPRFTRRRRVGARGQSNQQRRIVAARAKKLRALMAKGFTITEAAEEIGMSRQHARWTLNHKAAQEAA